MFSEIVTVSLGVVGVVWCRLAPNDTFATLSAVAVSFGVASGAAPKGRDTK